MGSISSLLAAAAACLVPVVPATAQVTFGAGCAGASGVTPRLDVVGVVRSGQDFTLEVTAPGGAGLGFLLVGASSTSATALGGLPLPLDLAAWSGDALWNACDLLVDPLVLLPYAFDPSLGGGAVTFSYPGFDVGRFFVQALNVDADLVTRVAGLSEAADLIGSAELVAGMVPIAPGTFQMGSTASLGAPYYPQPIEQPVRSVTITYPFWMGRYEVTQAEYEALTGTNPSEFVGPNRPVEQVEWLEAVAYCQALTAQQAALGKLPAGYEYRLPTEAEWEYACRAGTTTEFNVGDALVCSDARFERSFHSGTTCSNPVGTADVGSYAPNAWGLYDMHGNAWEWCLDTFADYVPGPATDPFVTGGTFQVVRGGGWDRTSSVCRSAYRIVDFPGLTDFDIGFRVVLAPALAP